MAIRGAVIGDGERAEEAAAADVRLSVHEDLSPLEGHWCAFEQRADATVFQSFEWLSSWQRHIGSRHGVRPAIVIGRSSAHHMLFLLPLAVEPARPARCLSWLGTGINDYNAPLLAPEFPRELGSAGFAALWPKILRRIQDERELRFDVIRLERMPRQVGNQSNPFVELPVTPHPSGAYMTRLAGDWDTFYAASRSSATRRRDRRKRKHLEEIGKVRLVTPQGDDELARSFDTLVAQKTRAFAAMGVPNMFRSPGRIDFYRSLVLGARDVAHLSRLDVGDVPAALGLGLRFRGSYYLVLSSYDGGLSRLSPGSAHLHELIRHAIESGCAVFDFTVGDEPYKRDWAESETVLFDHVSAARPQGVLVALALLAGVRVKRAIKQTPALWNAFSKARGFVGALRSRLLGNKGASR